MDQKETTTSKIKMSQKRTSSEDDLPQEVKNVKETSPTTPTTSSSSSWWSGLISQAKEKSASVLQAVKNDLDEITIAVTETFHIAPAEEGENLEEPTITLDDTQQQSGTVNYMKQSLSSFFGSVTDALIPQLDEEDATEAVLITSDDTIVLSGFTKHLAELQDNDETYLEEPSKSEEHAEKYRMWLEIVEQDQFTQQKVDKMLETSQILNEKYNKFVPETVTHMNFFKRYLFKRALLEDELANEERRRKEVVIQKQPEPVAVVEQQKDQEEVKKVEPAALPVLPADIGEIANFELSEEEQARLLSDYEQEIKEREKSKTELCDAPTAVTKSAMKSKNPPKSSSNVQSSKGKNNKNVKHQQQQKSTQQQTSSKGGEKTKKTVGLKVESNHFKKEVDSSSTSDESWEKEFDL